MKQVFKFITRIQYMNQARHLFYEPSNWSEQKKQLFGCGSYKPWKWSLKKRVMPWSSQRRNAQHLFWETMAQSHFNDRPENSWKNFSFLNDWSKIWNHLCVCYPVSIVPKSPPHCFYGEDKRKGLASDINLCLNKSKPTHQRFDLDTCPTAHSPWHSCQAKSEVLMNETSNSWRLRSEQFYGG